MGVGACLTASCVACSRDHVQLLVNQTTKTVWFFNLRDGQWLPTMQTLHQCAHSPQPHLTRLRARH
jgi:hypothetical protein